MRRLHRSTSLVSHSHCNTYVQWNRCLSKYNLSTTLHNTLHTSPHNYCRHRLNPSTIHTLPSSISILNHSHRVIPIVSSSHRCFSNHSQNPTDDGKPKDKQPTTAADDKKKKSKKPKGTVKTYNHKVTRKRVRNADGTVKEWVEAKHSMSQSVNSGTTEVRVTVEKDTSVNKEISQENELRETKKKQKSTTKHSMKISSPQGEEEKKQSTTVSDETSEYHKLDDDGNVISHHSIKPQSSTLHSLSGDSLLGVGNPSEDELARRKAMLTPHALIIHPDRLLPTFAGRKAEDESGFRSRIKRTWQKISSTFTKKVIGEQTLEDMSETVSKKYTEWQDHWDTTQNPHLVAVRSLMDRLAVQTETSRAMEILQEEMEDFWVEDFLPEFSEKILPQVVRAYLEDDLAYLSEICTGEAAVFCKNMIEARMNANLLLSNDILWINEADLIETKLGESKIPQIVVRAEVQSVDCVYDRTNPDNVVEGSPSLVANNVFMLTLEPNLDEQFVAAMNGYPWQIRTFQTARVRQLV